MNKRQQNQISNLNNLNEYLEQFGAKVKDGEKYINSSTKLTILNKFNIEKNIEPYVIKRLKSNSEFWTFDGVDSDKQKQELEKLKNLVESKGGSIKEGQRYINKSTGMYFIDEYNSEFFSLPKTILDGYWRDSSAEYNFEKIKLIIKANGWTIKQGQKYINANTNMIFINSKGEEFKMTPSRVKQGFVENKDAKYYYKNLKEKVESKGGKIKDGQIYVNNRTKMTFIDENGIEFEKKAHQIMNGYWNDGLGLSEEICRQCIEFIFNKSFPTDWSTVKVNNNSKNNLQLDGYNKELKIAFEYQGEQHYCYKYMRGKSNIEKYKLFKKQKERDLFKENFCKNKGIKIIHVKYFDKTLKNDIDYLNHVIQELLKNNINYNKYLSGLDFKNFKLKNITPRKERYLQIKRIVENKGGKFKPGFVYKGNNKMIDLIDENDKEFSITPLSLLKGSWSDFSINQNSTYQIEKIELNIKKFGAKIKDKKSYRGKYSYITLINKYGVEKDYPAHYLKKIDSSSPFWEEKGNEREKRTELLNKILSKNGSSVKNGQLYIHNTSPLIIVNKYGLEIEMTPKNIMRISDNHPFFYDDGITTESQKNLSRLNEILSEYNGKIKNGEEYKDNITHLIVVNKLGEEIKLTPKSIKSLSNKHKLWLSK